MAKWTDKQRAAIDHRGGNLLISASAGSGKTAVVIERLHSLLLEGINPKNLLVVTFTHAAAEEMRERLIKRLAAETDTKSLSALANMDDLEMSTLHAFCIKILREHFDKAGIDPGFSVLDQSDANLLINKALERVLEAYCEEKPALFSELLFLYGPMANIADDVRRIYLASLHEENPGGYIDASVAMYEKGGASGLPLWRETLCHMAREHIRAAIDYIKEALSMAELEEALSPCIPILLREEEALCACLAAKDVFLALSPFPFEKRMASVKGDFPEKAAMTEARDEAKELIKKACKYIEIMEKGGEDIALLHPIMLAFGEMAKRLSDAYAMLKSEQGVLDFSDLEHIALSVLADEDAKSAYRRRFAFVFVDEYQDISSVQDAIIRALTREGDAGNAFLVGDVKQSIYRFRSANPLLFIEKQNSAKEGGPFHALTLPHNFRSRRNILHAVNAVFSRVMQKEDAEIAYDEEARLVPGRDFEGDDPPAELHIISAFGSFSQNGQVAIQTSARKEAALIALRAKKLHEEEGIPYRDMAILLRAAQSDAPAYVEVLTTMGIGAIADVSGGFFDVWEIASLLALLRVIYNMQTDVALLSALRVFGGFSEDSLALMRKNAPTGSFYDAFMQAAESDEDARAFYDHLAAFRTFSQMQPVNALLWHVLEETRFVDRVRLMEGASMREANINALIGMTERFVQRRGSDLSAYLLYMETLRYRGESPEPAKLSENDDVLRIMTVHKSKGLEFSVVFVAGLGKTIRPTRAGELPMHPRLGIALPYVKKEPFVQRKTLAHHAIVWQKKREDLAEEARILYVALTRAKERLILVATADIETLKAPPGGLLFTKSFLHMVLAALPFLHGIGEEGKTITTDGARFFVQTHDEIFLHSAEAAPEKENIALPDSVIKLLHEEYVPPAAVPEKITVTEFRRHAANWAPPEDEQPSDAPMDASCLATASGIRIPEALERPRFAMANKGPTPVQRGNATHGVLALLDFAALAKAPDKEAAIRAQIDGFLLRGLYDEEEAALIDTAALAAFFASPLGERMLLSARVEREAPFNLSIMADTVDKRFPNEPMLLQGVIDACFLEDGAWVLVEYKTDRQPTERIESAYRLQVLLYKQALETLTGMPVKEAYIYAFSHGQALAIR